MPKPVQRFNRLKWHVGCKLLAVLEPSSVGDPTHRPVEAYGVDEGGDTRQQIMLQVLRSERKYKSDRVNCHMSEKYFDQREISSAVYY